MIRVCPVVTRVLWKIKSALWPWADQSKAPEPKPKMREADAMLKAAIFDLSQLLDERRRQ